MTKYSRNFYNAIRQGCIDSAETVAPVVQEAVKAKTVIDIGCGEGHWAKAFEDLGAEVVGVDGAYITEPRVPFVAADISKALPSEVFDKKYDLLVNLEVAEHLPARRADSFVADLCELSDNLLFSAAIPSQGGVDHINEQWFSTYWLPRFQNHGYEASGALRFAFWDNEKVEWWYKQNLMFITKEPEKYPSWFGDSSKPIDLIHPILWNSRT